MFRAEELEQFDESLVVAGIEGCFVFTDIKPGICKLVQNLGDELCCNFLVEEIRFFRGQGTVIELLEAFDEFLVGVEKALKLLGVKDEILVDIGNYELFELDVFLGMALAKVVKKQFLQGFAVQIFSRDHFRYIPRHLDLEDDAYWILNVVSKVDSTVNLAIWRNLVSLAVERQFEKVHQIALNLFFGVDDGNLFVEVMQLCFERIKRCTVHGNLAICLIQGLGYCQFGHSM